MDYKKLNELDNTYPTPNNYKKGAGILSLSDAVVLTGVYPEKNKIDFKVPSINDLKWVPDTEFRFILAIFKTYSDTNPIYYTSEAYYNDLKASLAENNPYLIQLSFLPSNIVSYVVEDVLATFDSFRESELKSFINFRQNIAFRSGSIVDYDNLVTYIDWVVSPVSALDEPNYGVLKPETIAGWDQLVGNYSTGKLGEGVSGSFGIGSEFVELSNTTLKDTEKDLAKQKAELEKLMITINELEDAIKTKKSFIYNIGSVNVILSGVTYSAKVPNFLGINLVNTTTQANLLIGVLKTKLNELYESKKSLDTNIGIAIVKVNTEKAASKKPVDLNAIQNLLPPKIPKIPKLPDIPKIPKLPSLDSLGGGIIAALPAIPAIPKLSFPKLPSFKFPTLPKFKKKEPNEPKKFKIKKTKGLTDLSNAANSAKGAASNETNLAQSATSQINGTINKGAITTTTQLANGGTLTTTTLTSGVLKVGETEASVLKEITDTLAEAKKKAGF